MSNLYDVLWPEKREDDVDDHFEAENTSDSYLGILTKYKSLH